MVMAVFIMLYHAIAIGHGVLPTGTWEQELKAEGMRIWVQDMRSCRYWAMAGPGSMD